MIPTIAVVLILLCGILAIILLFLRKINAVKRGRFEQEEGANLSLGFKPPQDFSMDTILKLTGGNSQKAISFLEWMSTMAKGQRGQDILKIVETAAEKGWSDRTVQTLAEALLDQKPVLAQHPAKKSGFFQQGPPQDANSLWQEEEGI